jgi:hypothetical protein
MKDFVDMTGAEDMLQSMVTKASAVPVKPVAPAGGPNVGSVISTAVGAAKNYKAHVVPPGAETLGEALADLPHDAADWLGSHDWFSGLGDWLHHLSFAAPLTSLVNAFSGGALQWVTVAFLGLKIIDLGRGLLAPGQRVRGPVSLVYYRIPAQTIEPVLVYLQNSAQVEVRDKVQDGEYMRLGIPIYHSGRATRAFEYLHAKTGLEYTKI